MDSVKNSNTKKYFILVVAGIFVITIILFSCLQNEFAKKDVDSFDISYNSSLFAVENKNAYYPIFINNSPQDAELLFSIHNNHIDKNISIQSSTGAIIVGKHISTGIYPVEILVVSSNSRKYVGEKIISTTIIVIDAGTSSGLKGTEKSIRDLSQLIFQYPESKVDRAMVTHTAYQVY